MDGVRPSAARVALRLSKCRQGFENRLNNVDCTGPDETTSDGFGGDRRGRSYQVVAYGTDAFGERNGPGKAPGVVGLEVFFFFHLHPEAGLGLGGLLEFGTEPADQAQAFFGSTGSVEFDYTVENVLSGQIDGPAVSVGQPHLGNDALPANKIRTPLPGSGIDLDSFPHNPCHRAIR